MTRDDDAPTRPADPDALAAQFESTRPHLRSIALRMLGSSAEADDAVQEAWLRLNRSDSSEIDNLAGWLTTVVGRVCLDMLRSRTSRREDLLDTSPGAASVVLADVGGDPAHDVAVADSIGVALLVVLETLAPAERVAFVLHDLFAVPFDEIGPIVGRTSAAARKLASRARTRVQGERAEAAAAAHVERQRAVVEAFLAAARGGDIETLLRLLDPDVRISSDAAAKAAGAAATVQGADDVARLLSGRAKAAKLALIDGTPGFVWAPGGAVRVIVDLTIVDDAITAIHVTGDAAEIAATDLHLL